MSINGISINKIFTNNQHFDEMMNIINEARLNPPSEGHKHHIIPKCWFKKNNLDVDNSDKNLVLLSYDDHVKVHELSYHCCKSNIMKRNMAYAYHRLTEGEMVENGCMKGEKSPRFGKQHSAESRRKISEGNKGKVISDEHRRKISEAQKGKVKVFSYEHGRKISESLRGRVFSGEHRKNLSEAKKGKVLSEEHRRKLSESRKGMTWKTVDGKRIYSKIKKYDQLALELG